MCGLCGAIDSDRHWVTGADDGGDAPPHLRSRERLRLATLATGFLAPLAISVEDFGGHAFIVRGATGAAEIVASLPEVWRAAERLGGRPIDILRPPVHAAGL